MKTIMFIYVCFFAALMWILPIYITAQPTLPRGAALPQGTELPRGAALPQGASIQLTVSESTMNVGEEIFHFARGQRDFRAALQDSSSERQTDAVDVPARLELDPPLLHCIPDAVANLSEHL